MNSQQSLRSGLSVFSKLGTAALLFVFILLIFGVFAQNMNLSGPWWREVATIMTFWLVYLNIGELAVNDDHITVRYFFDRFPPRLQRVISSLLSIISTLTVATVLVAGITGVMQVQGSTTPINQLPTALLYFPLVVGMGLLTIVYLFEVGWKVQGILE